MKAEPKVSKKSAVPPKKRKPDKIGVLVGEICLVQWWTKRLIIDAERYIADLKSVERYLDRLREENRIKLADE